MTPCCSYRRHPYNTRNNAPTYAQNGVEIYLDTAGSNRCWVIQVQGRQVYRMQPNALDADYASCPNVDGVWVVAEAMPGVGLSRCALALPLMLHRAAQARCHKRLVCLRYTSKQQPRAAHHLH